MPKLGTQKISYLSILGRNFKKTIVIFETSAVEFVYLQNFVRKRKYLNLETKMPYLGSFWLEFSKNYRHIWNQYPEISLIREFSTKQKCINLELKMPYLGISALEFEKLLSYWNQHPRIYLISKSREKIKMHKFGTKNALFRYFWARFFKKLSWYLNLSNYEIKKQNKTKQKCLHLWPKIPYLGIFELEF